MTRLWNVEPAVLCEQHLLGEHSELHMIAGTIQNHPHGEAIVRGHADKGQVDTSLIQPRHDELAEELELRGMNHNSPLEFEDTLGIGEVDVDANRRDLAQRCDDCLERMTGKHGYLVLPSRRSLKDRHLHRRRCSPMTHRDLRAPTEWELLNLEVCKICIDDLERSNQDHGYYQALQQAAKGGASDD